MNYLNLTSKVFNTQRTKVLFVHYRTRVMLMHFGVLTGGVNAQPN
jgi:hypothetical protein